MAHVDNAQGIQQIIPRPGVVPEQQRNQPQNQRVEERDDQDQQQARRLETQDPNRVQRQEQDRVDIQRTGQEEAQAVRADDRAEQEARRQEVRDQQQTQRQENRAAATGENQRGVRIPRPGRVPFQGGGEGIQQRIQQEEEVRQEREFRERPALEAPPQNVARISLDQGPPQPQQPGEANAGQDRPPTVIERQIRNAAQADLQTQQARDRRPERTPETQNRQQVQANEVDDQTRVEEAEQQRANEARNNERQQRNVVSTQTQRGRNVDRLI